ncbi:MFS transporter, SP family, sugar:H+ symporter [Purpureocillium lavendulum]|uniref:MFS transporter, SP family, sugar:H+ symporter n=1 Tax=Purpureocillium lavendulum TaxID=1247861 RepID=A0AB34FDU3_9HYPO|nr:MFS transporter, SP family, sugar:H+ symporter [Purpureocillium lavendulum]
MAPPPQAESQAGGPPLTFAARIKEFTPMVLFMTFYLAVTAWNYGYDVSVFAGVQAMDPFVKRFGTYNAATQKYAIKSYLVSILNSFPYLGKLLGCWVATPLAERVGPSDINSGVLLQITATTVAQFTVGRMLCYAMTGICVNVMPAYMAECAPASLRGMVTSQLQMQIVVAQLVASAVNFGTSRIKTDAGWRISVGIQFIMPGLLLVLWPMIVESPRWLLSQDRFEDATVSLRRLRKKDVPEEVIQDEVNLLGHVQGNEGKGSWKEVFAGTNRRRTVIAIIVMVGQQITGQAFVSQYSVTFYKQQGYTNNFELGMIQQALGVAANILTTVVVDSFGRRRILLIGGVANSVFLFILGGTGSIAHPSTTEKRLLVASVMIWFYFYLLSWASVPYIVLGEASTRRVVEKTSNLAVSLSVLSAFLVSFTAPYLIGKDYANLGGKVGFIYGALSVLFTGLTWNYVPEMKGRSLEDIDSLFEKKVPTRKFRTEKISAAQISLDKLGEKNIINVFDHMQWDHMQHITDASKRFYFDFRTNYINEHVNLNVGIVDDWHINHDDFVYHINGGLTVKYYENNIETQAYGIDADTGGVGPDYYLRLKPLGTGMTDTLSVPYFFGADGRDVIYIPADPVGSNYYPGLTNTFGGITFDANNFTLVFTGYYKAPESGPYTFCADTDNVDNFYIGSVDAVPCGEGNTTETVPPGPQPLVYNYYGRTRSKTCGTRDLVKGYYYPVRSVFGNWGTPSHLTFTVKPPGGEETSMIGDFGYPSDCGS